MTDDMADEIRDVLDRADFICRIVLAIVVSASFPVLSDWIFGDGYLWLAVRLVPEQVWYGLAPLLLFHFFYDWWIGSRYDW